jgi:hypothetical protein
MEIEFDGKKVPVIGTVNCNDYNTYSMECGPVLAWVDGEPWNGFGTSVPMPTPFRTIDEAKMCVESVVDIGIGENKFEPQFRGDSFSCSKEILSKAIDYYNTWMLG